jgi:EAL and modified HD-GYP domain-containing signal transduction protein
MIQSDPVLVDSNSADIFLGRNPILDIRGKIVAYEMLFRSKESLDNHTDDDDLAASSNIIINAMSHFGLESVLGDVDGFIPVSEKMLVSNTIDLLPPRRIVLELIDFSRFGDDAIERLQSLKRKGFRFAVEWFNFSTANEKITPLLDYIKVNLALTMADGRSVVLNQLSQPNFKALVTEIRKKSPALAIFGFFC